MQRETVPDVDWRYEPPGRAKSELMAAGRWYYARTEGGGIEGRWASVAPPWCDPFYDIAFMPDGLPASAADRERMERERRERWSCR
jgi:hypothetical protein